MSGSWRSLVRRFDKTVGVLVALACGGLLMEMAWENSRLHTNGSPWTWVLPAAGAVVVFVIGCLVAAPLHFYEKSVVRVMANLCGFIFVLGAVAAFLFAGVMAMIGMSSDCDMPPLWMWMNPLWLVTAGVMAIAAAGVLFSKDGMGSELRMMNEVERLRRNRQGGGRPVDGLG